MINRKLHQAFQNSNTLKSELLQKLSIQFKEELLTRVIAYNGIDIESNSIQLFPSDHRIEFIVKTSEHSSVFMNITEDLIHFGFKIAVATDEVNLDTTRALQSVRNRYYYKINTSNKGEYQNLITSDFSIKINQLSSRDFMDYAEFILANTLLLVSDIESRNLVSRKELAA